MKIFACDSTAKTASVALCEDNILLAEFTQNGGNTHSETLLPMTEVLLNSMKTDIDEIDVFAVSEGPGSFTGVRIGAATVKGFAHRKDKPCIGVSTLEALARNLAFGEDRIIIPVMDARRGQFYTAKFAFRSGKLERIGEDTPMSFEDFLDDVRALGERVYLCGDGYAPARKLLGDELSHETPEKLRYQSAYSVAQIAYEKYLAGDRTSAEELRPTYLRLPQAERDRLNAEKLKG
jgi:tRNA threonylcarbamoyladenosine biosynthesis protein TsaB